MEETIILSEVFFLCILGSPYAFGRRETLETQLVILLF